MLAKLFCVTLILLPAYVAAISEPTSNSDLSATQYRESPQDVGRPTEYHEIIAMLDGLNQPMLNEIKHHVSILRTLDQPSLQKFRHLVSQHLPAATEQPEGTEAFAELDEENSAGRRGGGQTAAGGFAWAAASGNRAGNSEDDEELGQEDSSSQAAATRRKSRRRRKKADGSFCQGSFCCQAWSSTGDNECRVCGSRKTCKHKYGKDECKKYCWKYINNWLCPGCFQEAEAKKVASAITATWESKRGLEYCKANQETGNLTKVMTVKLTKVMSEHSFVVEEWKKALGASNAELHVFDVSNITADFRWRDHILLHRSGIHEANAGEVQLCASWTAVCLGTPPSHGQSCATVRKVVGCRKTGGGDRKWYDCSEWHSVVKLGLSNLA